MEPPIRVTRRSEIASPKPVPPNLRVVAESAWVKARNSLPDAAAWMPIPVSITRKRRAGPCSGFPPRANFHADAAGLR